MFILLIPLGLLALTWLLIKLNRDYALASFTRKIKTIDGSPLEETASVVGGFWGSNFDLLSMNLGVCAL